MLQPKPVKKTESTVIKPVAKKDKYKSLGGEIGRPTGPKTGRVKPTMGTAKNGTSMKKAQGGVTQKGKSVMKAYVDKYKGSGGLSDTYDVSRDTLGGNSPRDQYYNGGFGGTRMKQINDLEAAHDKKFGKNSTVDERKNGGKVNKAKNGKSFPDLNKDGKITKADVLKGRGVIAKKGAVIKKAQGGTKVVKGSRPGMGVFRTTKERTTSGGVTEPYKYKTESIDTTGYSKGRNNYKVKTVEGEGDKTRSKVTSTKSKVISRKDVPSTLKSLNKAKTGGSMKKCKGGC